MKVLSLFDGMACGMLAFRKVGIEVESYVAYEIDKYAIKVSTHNFPMIEQRGDVFHADFTEFEGFDFVIGGSPCTYWSIAQKKDVRETEAHGIGWELFQQYVRAIKEAKPKYFIYENNKSMAQAIKEEISEAFGFEPIMINSALVSAQNRQRYYWVGIRQEDGTYRKADVEQPEDLGILLKDVLVAEPINTTEDGTKARTLMAGYYKYGMATLITNDGFKGGTTAVAEPIGAEVLNINPSGKGMNGAVIHTNGKSRCLTTNKGEGQKIIEPIRVGSLPRPNGELSTSQAMRVYSDEGKGVGLKACGGGMGGKTGLYAVPMSGIYPTGVLDVYEVKDGLISIKGKQYPIKLEDGLYTIRKLTVSECKRLQTVPDDYDMSVISNTQAYKCLGNGWTVDVIAHILSSLKRNC